MKAHKTYLIIELHTNRILHVTTDKMESMKEFEKLQKSKVKVTAQCIYQ